MCTGNAEQALLFDPQKTSDKTKDKEEYGTMIAMKWHVTPERWVPMTMMSDKQEMSMVTPADWVPGPRQGEWTYEMYSALPEDGHRYEIIQGVLMMSPAPEIAHQAVIMRLSRYLDEQIFSTERGWVFLAPTDVVLSSQKVVQPDILVLLHKHQDRLKKRYIEGAPDLIVEVISPGSAIYDRLVKHSLYVESGVPEYWLVNLQDQSIEVFVLEGKHFHSPGLFRNEQQVKSLLIPNETLQAAHFFNWGWKRQ